MKSANTICICSPRCLLRGEIVIIFIENLVWEIPLKEKVSPGGIITAGTIIGELSESTCKVL